MKATEAKLDLTDGLSPVSNPWSSFFERLLVYFSAPQFESELLKAKSSFFEKLGRSHETREDAFDAASQSFLEWYIFDYRFTRSQKTPAIFFIQNRLGSDEDQQALKRALFHHLSLFEVLDAQPTEVRLKDLLFSCERRLQYDARDPGFRVWKPTPKQVVQARCFHSDQEPICFATHVWLHADSESELLKELALGRAETWGLHREFLKDSLEALIRSLSLRDQMRAVNARNWLYQELKKKYAPSK